ncbi:MAG: hypothetical protein ABSG97_02555 [Sedimentisphaerales bacterium]|jgi:ppGpp synthetase/RelA/SpoT-type nucleotidyltranferase
MDIDKLKTEYSQCHHKYEKLKDEIKFILEEELKAAKIPCHLIEGRIKTIESVIDKIKRIYPEKQDLKLDDIVDICGVRVICLFLSDVEKIGKIIEEKFKIERIDDKILSQPQEEFGYMSVHYIGSLPSDFSGPRYNQIKDLRFEIQVRTIAMHSWATISHYLDYKSPHAIPSHLRKDFYGLSAIFYLADSHFELFFRNIERAKKAIETKASSKIGLQQEEINFNTLVEYLKQNYPDRRHFGDEYPQDISDLVEELVKAGYKTISDLDKDLKRSWEAFVKYEEKYPPANEVGEPCNYADIGIVRASLRIANPKMANTRSDFPEYKEFRKFLRP